MEMARTLGVVYTTASGLAETKPVGEIVDRLDLLDETTIKSPAEVHAILGGAE